MGDGIIPNDLVLLQLVQHSAILPHETIRFYHRTHVFFADIPRPVLLLLPSLGTSILNCYFYPDFGEEEKEGSAVGE